MGVLTKNITFEDKMFKKGNSVSIYGLGLSPVTYGKLLVLFNNDSESIKRWVSIDKIKLTELEQKEIKKQFKEYSKLIKEFEL